MPCRASCAPGCARSPVENGFDWVLMRLLAGIKVTRSDLTGMGVGGLLMEIVTRGQPRSVPDTEGNQVALHDLLKRGPVILAFFPKAFTAG